MISKVVRCGGSVVQIDGGGALLAGVDEEWAAGPRARGTQSLSNCLVVVMVVVASISSMCW